MRAILFMRGFRHHGPTIKQIYRNRSLGDKKKNKQNEKWMKKRRLVSRAIQFNSESDPELRNP